MPTIEAAPGDTIDAVLVVSGGESGLFARAQLYSADLATVEVSWVSATEAVTAHHVASFTLPAGEADYQIVWELYDDAGFTTSAAYVLDADRVAARSAPAVPGEQMALTSAQVSALVDAVWTELVNAHVAEGSAAELLTAAAARAGLRSIIDGGSTLAEIPHTNNVPDVARLRYFATAAAYASANPGDTGDGGAAMTLDDSPVYDDGDTVATPRVLASLRSTTG